eukprot:3279565-Prymnesium_polylepis.1
MRLHATNRPPLGCVSLVRGPAQRSGLVLPLRGLGACHTRHGICSTQTINIRQPGGSGEVHVEESKHEKRIFGRTDAGI